jgi:hypothetical protein
MDESRSCSWCGKTIRSVLFFCGDKCRHEYNTTKGTEQPLVDEKYIAFLKEETAGLKKIFILVVLLAAGGVGVFLILNVFFGSNKSFGFLMFYVPVVVLLTLGRLFHDGIRQRNKYR